MMTSYDKERAREVAYPDGEDKHGKAPRFLKMALDTLDEMEKERDVLKAADICDACAGTGKPISGLTCMCHGTGKMSRAAIYLREELFETEAERDAALAKFDAMERERDAKTDACAKLINANGALSAKLGEILGYCQTIAAGTSDDKDLAHHIFSRFFPEKDGDE